MRAVVLMFLTLGQLTESISVSTCSHSMQFLSAFDAMRDLSSCHEEKKENAQTDSTLY